MNILLLIPSYNDNQHLPELFKAIRQCSDLPILLIDDGSTEPIIHQYDETITIIRNKSNLGKGATLKKGFQYANKNGYSHIITMDSDQQHSPDKLKDFSKYDEHCDLVYGKRVIDKSMPIHRRLSNRLTSWIISFLCGQKIHDSQCGFRRYSVRSVINIECVENGFQFESEMLVKLLKENATIGHITIPTMYGDEVSSIHNINDTFKFIKLILANL